MANRRQRTKHSYINALCVIPYQVRRTVDFSYIEDFLYLFKQLTRNGQIPWL
jgi:hypothetical protein